MGSEDSEKVSSFFIFHFLFRNSQNSKKMQIFLGMIVLFLFIYLLINIKINKSVIPHQCISVINEADIVEKKIEIKRVIKKKKKIIFDIKNKRNQNK